MSRFVPLKGPEGKSFHQFKIMQEGWLKVVIFFRKIKKFLRKTRFAIFKVN